jgi:colicin import membrane protein
VQNEINKAVADAIQRTEMKRSQEIELLKRDSEFDKRIAELKIKTLEESLLRGLEQLAAMQTQVNDAKKQVQDIAVKAIEGASGSKTLQFAMEQAKARTASN